MLGFFRKLLKKDIRVPKSRSTDEKGITKEEVYSFEQGLKLVEQRNYEAALTKFDIAISTGIFNEAYRERGYCLQIMKFHLDAIDDFSRAIELFPNNGNNYYGRSLSKGSLGYYDSAIEDAKKAIELSLIDSKENSELYQIVNNNNIITPTLLYKNYLDELIRRKNFTNEQLKLIYINPPIRRNRK